MSRHRLVTITAILLGWIATTIVLQPDGRAAGEPPTRPAGDLVDDVLIPPRSHPLPTDAPQVASPLVPPRSARPEKTGRSEPPPSAPQMGLLGQSREVAESKSHGCVACHKTVGDPHGSQALSLGCVDCHGGDATARDKQTAHVAPRHPEAWTSSANPIRSYTLLNHESPEFIRFVNPGDLRIAHQSCGTVGCHPRETLEVKKSMMTHGCMLWGAALYNNGSVHDKWPQYGESYSMHGTPQRLQTVPPPTPEETRTKGILPFLDPLPRFQVTHPGNILRIFERGGRFRTETGIPERLEEPGRPRERLSNRGLGTLNRTDPVFVGLQKTRLLDPTLNFLGTNEQPGDYRSSGCTACHIVYANDRSVIHSGPYARYGNTGRAASQVDSFVTSVDPTIPKNESGHPIAHRFTRAIPTSQCMICHIHPGTTVMNSYLGYMWWDQETDGDLIYDRAGRRLSAESFLASQMANPNLGAIKRYDPSPDREAGMARINDKAARSQFADFHGHGWLFRAVFRKNAVGQMLDHRGRTIKDASNNKLQQAIRFPEKVRTLYRNRTWTPEDQRAFDKARVRLETVRDHLPVHLMDIHLERGMHCVDCHFLQDVHGNTKLYGEVRAAIEITCQDCHGDTDGPAIERDRDGIHLRTSGPAAADASPHSRRGRNLLTMRTPDGRRRFEVRDGVLIQRSMVEPDLSWAVTQVRDTIDPTHANYNALSALSKTVAFDDRGQMTWGQTPSKTRRCAHDSRVINCTACHTSWNPSCFGCHLSQRANQKMPSLHNEGDISRNYVSYNFQTLRDDVFMLGRDGTVTGNRINPVRSACAIHVSSYNPNRESIYYQQQTISAEGLSGIAFSTNVPHTVRGRDGTRQCRDCHLADSGDNNARMAQLLMHGTKALNFMGRWTWIAAGDHGLHAAEVTERDEPQAVLGSSLHQLAFPEHHAKLVADGRQLHVEHEHPGMDVLDEILAKIQPQHFEVLSVQHRGEYLYAACGSGGLKVFDIAMTDNKGFSERIVTAPVSPLGQRLYVKTQYATDVAAPATTAPDPTREASRRPGNQEGVSPDKPLVHPMYAFLYVTDLHEGLVMVGAGTLLDGNPTNNFLSRALTFNPDGILKGAREITIAGTCAYICCDVGLVVVSLDDPINPKITTVLDHDTVSHPSCVQVQFRYAFVTDHSGLVVLDVTDLQRPVLATRLKTPPAHRLYVSRTYAYLAAGKDGLVIVDVANPRQPRIDQVFTAGGVINDLHDVKIGVTYSSLFAYLADGHNGLRIVQLTSPATPGSGGFRPRPEPRLIATLAIPHGGHALTLSEGVDRDRAVDEAGNQLSVFGRVGARPLTLTEQQRLYLHRGRPWTVPSITRDPSVPDELQRERRLQQALQEAIPGYTPPARLRR